MPTFKLAWLERLFHRHSYELKAFAGQRYGQETADDVVQEAYLRLLQHPDPASIDNARAFLYQTVANLTIDLHRRDTTRNRFVVNDQDTVEDLLSVTAPEKSPEEQLSLQQDMQRLNAALLELPTNTRHAFVLYRLEGLSHREIGLRLGISERSSVRLVAAAAHHLMLHFGSFEL